MEQITESKAILMAETLYKNEDQRKAVVACVTGKMTGYEAEKTFGRGKNTVFRDSKKLLKLWELIKQVNEA